MIKEIVGIALLITWMKMGGLGCAAHRARNNHSSESSSKQDMENELLTLRRDNAALRENLALTRDALHLTNSQRTTAATVKTTARPNELPTVRLTPPKTEGPTKRLHAKTLVGIVPHSDLDEMAPPEFPLAGVGAGEIAKPSPADAPSDPSDSDPTQSFADASDRPVLRLVNGSSPPSIKSERVHLNPPVSKPQPSPARVPQAEQKDSAQVPLQPAPVSAPVASGDIKVLYEQAWSAFVAQDYSRADGLWQQLLSRDPQHDLADNALYWRGEIAYHHGHTAAAMGLFLQVVERYPGANKAQDALLKLGLCYVRLGELERAKTVLRRVQSTHPGTEVARVAARKLQELESSTPGTP